MLGPLRLLAAAESASLRRSQAFCERLARRHAGNFYHGFRLLPDDQRRAMCALYSFLRVADDLADADGDVSEKRRRLDDGYRFADRGAREWDHQRDNCERPRQRTRLDRALSNEHAHERSVHRLEISQRLANRTSDRRDVGRRDVHDARRGGKLSSAAVLE